MRPASILGLFMGPIQRCRSPACRPLFLTHWTLLLHLVVSIQVVRSPDHFILINRVFGIHVLTPVSALSLPV